MRPNYNSEEFIRELIALYRSLPCLWRIKSAKYSNKIKKREAYAQLVAFFQQHSEGQVVTEAIVKKKIQGLRTVYRKELNKVEKSTKSGAGTEDVYVPSLWYFELMEFTRDQELPRRAQRSLQPNLDPEHRRDSPVVDFT
ncbi:uncharacterized protein ACNLHF_004022 [Anomaloglossus baeobatrachus]